MAAASPAPYAPRMRRALAGITAASVVALCLTDVATASPPSRPLGAHRGCDPTTTKPHFRGQVPSPRRVLGFPLGKKEATDQEIGRYWRVADRSSHRVVTGVTLIADLRAAISRSIQRSADPEVALIPDGPYTIPIRTRTDRARPAASPNGSTRDAVP